MYKRFLILANNSNGLYGFRKELLAALSEVGEVYAAVPNNGLFDELRQQGCQIIEVSVDRRGINPVTDAGLFKRYCQLIRKMRPSLVITYTIKPNIYGSIACQLFRIPYAVNITGLGTTFQKKGFLRSFVIFLYKAALRKAKVVFFENIGNLQTLLNYGVVQQAQCHLLNGAGVNLTAYSFSPYPTEISPIHFLFIGRIMEEKGINELFSAMKRLVDDGYPCQLDLLGYYEENFKHSIENYMQQGWLHYYGFQSDVRPFIAQAHCFILPSWHEGMANTNLECAAMGRPVITSRIHGCMEAVIEGESGLLCEPKNSDSLYDAMLLFCRMPHAQREAMGRMGRAHMEDNFDKRNIVADTLKGLGV